MRSFAAGLLAVMAATLVTGHSLSQAQPQVADLAADVVTVTATAEDFVAPQGAVADLPVSAGAVAEPPQEVASFQADDVQPQEPETQVEAPQDTQEPEVVAEPQAEKTADPDPAPAAQESAYDYSLHVGGYCANGEVCAQQAVDSAGASLVVFPQGVTLIAGHSTGSAGVIASFRPGDLVQVFGNGAGVYQVTGLHYVAHTRDTQYVPLGFAFQTCVGDQMVLAYAVQVG